MNGRWSKKLEINSWNDRIKVKQEAIIHDVLEIFSSNPRRLMLKLIDDL
jgi:hypothetical protein